ncbi:MAG: hypothetical protein K0U40_05590 [Betaproteobacteria bacterium]|nr:hypothetical protein [Betaproteobacteria bacterium]
MDDYIVGGWSQNLKVVPPKSFSYAMYGMVTNFPSLTTGTAKAPGWSPAKTPAPQYPYCKVLWTYGGAGGVPDRTPSAASEIKAIVDASQVQNWVGVDFDNESMMDIGNIVVTTQHLKNHGKESSYTFLAGWDYNNNHQGVHDVKKIAEHGAADRFILMCYGKSMWSMDDVVANVGPAIEKTIAQGVLPKKVILALTYKGLTRKNLDYFLNQVTSKQIGGLFIWEYPSLSNTDLDYICTKLGID